MITDPQAVVSAVCSLSLLPNYCKGRGRYKLDKWQSSPVIHLFKNKSHTEKSHKQTVFLEQHMSFLCMQQDPILNCSLSGFGFWLCPSTP